MQIITGRVPSIPPPTAGKPKYTELWAWLQDPANSGEWAAIALREVGLPTTSPKAKCSVLRHAAERAGLRVEVLHDDGLLFTRLRPSKVIPPPGKKIAPAREPRKPELTPPPIGVLRPSAERRKTLQTFLDTSYEDMPLESEAQKG